jgi:hypothetical protein
LIGPVRVLRDAARFRPANPPHCASLNERRVPEVLRP